MKVLFLNPQQELGGVQCLSAFLKRAGHTTALVNDPHLFDNAYVHYPALTNLFEDADHILGQVEAHRPDLVAVSVVTDDYGWALKWARRIKQRMAVPIVFGNAHPTCNAEEVLRQDCVDYVVRGEGEVTLLELVEMLEGKRRPHDVLGLGFKEDGKVRVNGLRPLIEDLDTLPFPDKDLYYDVMPYLDFGYTTMTGRGCPYHCTFCGNNTTKKLYKQGVPLRQRWTRRHSPAYVVDEILWARDRYHIAHVRFNDEDFSYNRQWIRVFCALYKEKVGVPYSAWVYPNTVDAEVARWMADSGCDTVEIGIQSGSERLRRDLMHRNTTDAQIARAIQDLKDAGIRVKVDVIMGLPSESKTDLDATAHLLSRVRPWNVFAFWLRYYPDAEILRVASQLGLLRPAQIEQLTGRTRTPAPGPDAPAAGFWVPELEQTPLSHRYLNFIVLLPILPRWFVDLLVRRDLVRFFPGFLNAFLLSNLSQLVNRDPTGEFRVRGRRMLVTELPAVLRRALSRLFTRRAPALELQGPPKGGA